MKLTSPYLRNLIRTIVPSAFGALTTYITSRLTTVDATVLATTGVTATSIYYAIIRAIEVKYPKVGFFLGAKSLTAPVTLQATGTVTPPQA